MSTSDLSLSEVLLSTDYFRGYSADQLSSLTPHFEVLRLAEDKTVFEEGSIGDAWFLVVDGEVVVSKRTPGRPAHDLSHLESGEGFGEMALIDGSARMATVRTSMPTILARLPREAFSSLLDANHPAATHLLRSMAVVLCQRLREMTCILQDVVEDPGPQQRPQLEGFEALFKAILLQN